MLPIETNRTLGALAEAIRLLQACGAEASRAGQAEAARARGRDAELLARLQDDILLEQKRWLREGKGDAS